MAGEEETKVAAKASGEEEEEEAKPAADPSKPESEAAAAAVAVAPEEEEGAILEFAENDVIAGRGAGVNLNKGNQKFRAICFKRKPEFDAASHAAKRRIAEEIVNQTKATNGRFLKRKVDKGPWFEITHEKAILKACQVMRDFQRVDRIALRGPGGRKRQRTTESTPMEEEAAAAPVTPLEPILENPYGVHDHDVLSGRGAFVNGHVGNQRFRKLCTERKPQFDDGSYTDKRGLASEVVSIIRGLEPPGRFLRKLADGERPKKDDGEQDAPEGITGNWAELSDDRAIHKSLQVMRDIARPDRINGRKSRRRSDEGGETTETKEGETTKDPEDVSASAAEAAAQMTMLAESTAADASSDAVEEAVAATEEALDKALESVPKEVVTQNESTEV